MTATGRRSVLLAALAAAAAAAWLAFTGGHLLPETNDGSDRRLGDTGAPDDLDPSARLSAAAREEAGRLRRFPGLAREQHGTGAVTGKVTAFVPGAGEKPVDGAEVEVAAIADDGKETRASATTDAGGGFTVAPVRALAGTVLRVRHDPYRELVVHGLVVEEGHTLDVGTLVFGAPTTLSGSVVDATGRPIGHALVSVEREVGRNGRFDVFLALRNLPATPGPLDSTRSEADGSFKLNGLPPGRYVVRATSPGYAAAFQTDVFVTVDGDSAGVRIVLDPGAGFTGRVFDATGAPVDGATVVAFPLKSEKVETFERHEARSASDGTYRLDTLTPEVRYFLEASADGHAPYGVVREARGSGSLDFRLVASGRVEGRVTDGKTGAPVAGATMLLLTGLLGAGTAPASVLADEGGHYVFEHALPGPLILLEGRAPGFEPARVGRNPSAPQEVRAGETLVLDVTLQKGAMVTGTVRGEDGRPLAFATVAAFIQNSRWDGERAVLTDASGAYRLEGLRPETWTLSVTAPGYAPPVEDDEVRLPVAEGGQLVRDFVLRAGGVVAGHVTTAANEAAVGARVSVVAKDSRMAGRVRDLLAVADGTGAYRISGAPPAIDLVVDAESDTGVHTRSPAFRVESGSSKTVDVVLSPGVKIIGHVVDAGGRPIGKARVRFGHVEPEDLARMDTSFRADEYLGTRTFVADAGGGFVCDRAPPGPVLLRVDADGFAPWFRRDLVVPPEGDLVGITVTLDGTKSVTGRVLGSDTGRPLAGAWVYAVTRGGDGASKDDGRVRPLVSSETGADGAFALHGLPPGLVDVGVSISLGYKNSWEDAATARRESVPAGSSGLEFRLVPQTPPAK